VSARVLLIGKPECHLCDDARVIVAQVCAELGEQWADQSILDDVSLYDEYWDKIPVVLVDGRIHDFWRVDSKRLRSALTDNRIQTSD
jgi:hypothetical protein